MFKCLELCGHCTDELQSSRSQEGDEKGGVRARVGTESGEELYKFETGPIDAQMGVHSADVKKSTIFNVLNS